MTPAPSSARRRADSVRPLPNPPGILVHVNDPVISPEAPAAEVDPEVARRSRNAESMRRLRARLSAPVAAAAAAVPRTMTKMLRLPSLWNQASRALGYLMAVGLVLMLCLGMLNGPAKDAGRVVAAAADTAEAAASFASSTLRAATTTTNTSAILISALGDAVLQLARDAWKGVDVINHECTGGTLYWFADDMDTIQVAAQQLIDNKWFRACSSLWTYTNPIHDLLRLGVSMRNVSAQLVNLSSSNRMTVFDSKASLRADGSVAVGLSCRVCTFTCQWSNPLWESLDFDPSARSDEITSEILALMNLLRLEVVYPDDGTANQISWSVLLWASAKRWLRKILLSVFG